MNKTMWGVRSLLLGIYLTFCFPVLMALGINVPGLAFLFMLDFHVIRALPLHLLYRIYGNAEITLRFGVDDILLMGVLLWPLLLLVIRPALWKKKHFRWSIYSYSALWFAGTVAASAYYYRYPFMDM